MSQASLRNIRQIIRTTLKRRRYFEAFRFVEAYETRLHNKEIFEYLLTILSAKDRWDCRATTTLMKIESFVISQAGEMSPENYNTLMATLKLLRSVK